MSESLYGALQEMRQNQLGKSGQARFQEETEAVCKHHPKVTLDDDGKCAKCEAGEAADTIEDEEKAENAEQFLGAFLNFLGEINDNNPEDPSIFITGYGSLQISQIKRKIGEYCDNIKAAAKDFDHTDPEKRGRWTLTSQLDLLSGFIDALKNYPNNIDSR